MTSLTRGVEPQPAELLRLLTARGTKFEDVRLARASRPARLRREVASLTVDELLVVECRYPRLVRRLLARRGLKTTLYAVAPSVRQASFAVPIGAMCTRRPRRLLDLLTRFSLTARARQVARRDAKVAVLATRGPQPGWWIVDAAALGEQGMHAWLSVELSWRGAKGGAIANVRWPDGTSRFVKIALDQERAERLRQEHAALLTIAKTAPTGSVRVPSSLVLRDEQEPVILIEQGLGGTRAASLAGSQIVGVFRQLSRWLADWHNGTSEAQHGTPPLPDALAAGLGVTDTYAEWLRDQWSKIGDRTTSVAVHGDLTLWNVIVLPDEQLAVVDWEEATGRGVPLSDLFYAAVDAELARGRHRSRTVAFDVTFPTASSEIGLQCRGVADDLRVDRSIAQFYFHHTWLLHAHNEQTRGGSGEFQEIVHERLAVHPDLYPWDDGA